MQKLEIYNVGQMCEMAGVSRSCYYKRVASGNLVPKPFTAIGKGLYFTKSQIDEFKQIVHPYTKTEKFLNRRNPNKKVLNAEGIIEVPIEECPK